MYPSNASDRFTGTWTLAGTAKDAGAYLRPEFAENYTAQYGLGSPHSADDLAFQHEHGDIVLRLFTRDRYPELPTLQDLVGGIEIFDGAGTTNKQQNRLEVLVQGIYAADAGLVLMVGSSGGGGVNVIATSGGLIVSPTPSPTPSPSTIPTPDASASASPAAGGGGGRRGRLLAVGDDPSPSPSPVPSPVLSPSPPATPSPGPSGSVAPTDRCDILFALRFRPIAYEPQAQQHAAAARRALLGNSDVGDGNVGRASSAQGVRRSKRLSNMIEHEMTLESQLQTALSKLKAGMDTGAEGVNDGEDGLDEAARHRLLLQGVWRHMAGDENGRGQVLGASAKRRSRSLSGDADSENDVDSADDAVAAIHGPNFFESFRGFFGISPLDIVPSIFRPLLEQVQDRRFAAEPWSRVAPAAMPETGSTDRGVDGKMRALYAGMSSAPPLLIQQQDQWASLLQATLDQRIADSSAGPQAANSRILLESISGSNVGSDGGKETGVSSADTLGDGTQRRPRSLLSAAPESLYPGARHIPLYGHAVSPNCNFSMNITATAITYDDVSLDDKSMYFSMAGTAVGMLLLVTTAGQFVASASQSAAFRVSILTIGMQAVMDCWCTFLYMIPGFLASSIFSSFAMTAFVHLVLFSVLEMRFMLLIWKARNPDAFQDIRREVTRLYCRFYTAITFTFMVLYLGTWGSVKFLLVVAYSYWWPQIMHSAQNDSRSGLKTRYIIIATIGRLLPPLYFFACPYNILYSLTASETRASVLQWANNPSDPFNFDRPQPGFQPYMLDASTVPAFASPQITAAYWSYARFAIFLVCWQLLQVVVLILQGKTTWGPRFFVPYVFLPAKYNYHRPIEVRDGRVVPDARATAAWVLHVRPVPAPEPIPTAPEGQTVSGSAYIAWAARHQARAVGQRWSSFVAGVRFFGQGCQQLLEDGLAAWRNWRIKRQYGGIGGDSGGGNGVFTSSAGGASAIHRSTSGAGAAATGVGAVNAGPVVAAPSSSGRLTGLLDLLTPRGRAAGQYARVGDSDAAAESAVGGSAIASSPHAAVGGVGSGPAGRRTTEDSLNLDDVEAGHGTGSAAAAAGSAAAAAAGGSNAEGADRRSGPDELVGDASFGAIDCVVCMEPITFPMRQRAYMVTPCDHLFHTQCLRPWMDQALQCPTCRLQLPGP